MIKGTEVKGVKEHIKIKSICLNDYSNFDAIGKQDMVLKQFVLTKCGRADDAFVGEEDWLQGLAEVLGDVVQQLLLADLKIV